jgi:hypothetical protein
VEVGVRRVRVRVLLAAMEAVAVVADKTQLVLAVLAVLAQSS